MSIFVSVLYTLLTQSWHHLGWYPGKRGKLEVHDHNVYNYTMSSSYWGPHVFIEVPQRKGLSGDLTYMYLA